MAKYTTYLPAYLPTCNELWWWKIFPVYIKQCAYKQRGSNFHAEWKDWHTLEKGDKEKVK